MLVYLIRHAQSQANAGHDHGLNSSLSPLGLRQVDALTKRLATTQFTAIYSSPFRRCLETVGPIAMGRGSPVRLRPELCEFQNLPPGAEASTDLPGVSDVVNAFPGCGPCPDWQGPMEWPPIDEPASAMIARSRSLAAFLKDRWPGEEDRILIIGHGSPIARLIEAWLTDTSGPSFRFVIDNATLSLLRFRHGVSSLLQLNDTSHLQDLTAPDSPFAPSAAALNNQGFEW